MKQSNFQRRNSNKPINKPKQETIKPEWNSSIKDPN